MRRRAPEGLLGGLWELPNALGHLDEAGAIALAEQLGARPSELVRSGRAAHVFSHVRWDMLWYHIACGDSEDFALSGSADTQALSCGTLWVSPAARREKHSLPSAFSKLLGQAGIED
jgi:A/G-specific adenine glycosylase